MQPVEERYADVEVPAYGIGGWYDLFLQSTLDNFMGVNKHGRPPGRGNQKVVIGPWIHNCGDTGRDTRTGAVDFGDAARIDLLSEHVRWFDHWLKGVDNGITQEPPVNVFVMGANRWRKADSWPVPGTRYTPFYLHSRGNANSLFGDGTLDATTPSSESPDEFIYDPKHPVMTLGGNSCCTELLDPVSMGPQDQQPSEWRPDVLVYTSSPLQEDLDVIGPVTMVLHAASDARDTDFTAKLVDVHANGTAINIAQGIIRARYRDSWEEPTLLEPGEVYRYEIDLWSTANRFLAGHSIRIEVSSSNFPQFDRNPNTGNAFGLDAELRVARQTILHDAEHPSHVVLPIVPMDG